MSVLDTVWFQGKMKCFQSTVHEPQERRSFWRKSWSVESIVDRGLAGEPPRPLSDTALDHVHPGPSLTLSGSQRPDNLRAFTYSELKTATRNFYRVNLLGEGGFGCVYRGVIKQKQFPDGEVQMDVAVKQLNRKGLQGHKEWLAEVNVLGLVDHPNLVKLVGYCAEDDNRGIQRLLVYEFMPNKSLEDHLFFMRYPVLSWQTRVRIALGTAEGLAYLHEGMEFQIIFRDFKTSNVLLDNDFNPKLSDFGLARQGPNAGYSHVTTAVVGTVGYAAPEYIQTGHLTSKSDVWSFGIVLLELLTGRRTMDKNRPKSEQRLLDWVRPYIRDGKKFWHLMDPRLEGMYPVKAAHSFATLASQCLQKQPRLRPKMREVAESLKAILELSEPAAATQSVSVGTSPQAVDHKLSQITPLTSKERAWSLREAISSVFTVKGTGFLVCRGAPNTC